MSKQRSSTPSAHPRVARPRVESEQAFNLDRPGFDDELDEELAETFLENVTGADDAATEHRAEVLIEEAGGPFVITSAAEEFADGSDESNPADAEQEALPTVSAR